MRTSQVIPFVASLLPMLVLGCSATTPEAAPQTAEAQIARGGKAYGAHCARCHGDAGQGTKKAPPVVGSGALPLEPRAGQKRAQLFHTALDVAKFVTQNMPPESSDRSDLTEQDYWAILAFDLSANGVAVREPVTPQNAASFVLHP